MTADRALFAILAAGLLLVLAANLPGHISYDSAAQLHEGRANARETWGPMIYARILGGFDRLLPGTALYVTASALLFFSSLLGLARLHGRVSWLGVAATLAVLLTPQVLIYQGIVWKDVAFANLAVAGLTCLARASAAWTRGPQRWTWLAGALAALACAALVRQNGLIAAAFAAAALGWIAARGGWLRGIAWGVGGLAAVVLCAWALDKAAVLPGAGAGGTIGDGLRILQNYDLAGAVAMDRAYQPRHIEAAAPHAAEVIRERAAAFYSAERVDFLDRDSALGDAFNQVPNEAAAAEWRDLILQRPQLYLRVRLEDFRWVFMTPVIDRCLPAYVGADAPPELLAKLNMARRWTTSDQELLNYWSWHLDTPSYSHLAYVVLALGLALLLLRRRLPGDVAVAALLLGGAAFAASFFVISIACDYRYLYFTDLSALAGLVYAAAHPAGLLGRRRSG